MSFGRKMKAGEEEENENEQKAVKASPKQRSQFSATNEQKMSQSEAF
jgi:hypothetical protein